MLSFSVFAQNSLSVLAVDSISNSKTKVYTLDLWKLGKIDSIVVGISAVGEIDLDSLIVRGGTYFQNLNYKGGTANFSGNFEGITGATLTINKDSAAIDIVQNARTLTGTELKGYNQLQLGVVSASSGNDATDPTQKFILYYQAYKPIKYSQ